MNNESQEVKEKGQIPIPSELQGKDLGTSPKTPESNQTEGVISIAEAHEIKGTDSIDSYVQHLHSYIREYISVADRKSLVVLFVYLVYIKSLPTTCRLCCNFSDCPSLECTVGWFRTSIG